MCAQTCGGGLKKSSSDENYNVLGLPKIVRGGCVHVAHEDCERWVCACCYVIHS